jgi:hypothetical protein
MIIDGSDKEEMIIYRYLQVFTVQGARRGGGAGHVDYTRGSGSAAVINGSGTILTTGRVNSPTEVRTSTTRT